MASLCLLQNSDSPHHCTQLQGRNQWPREKKSPTEELPSLPAPSMCLLPTAANPPWSACWEPFKGSSVLLLCSGLSKIGSRRAGQEMLISQMFSFVLPASPPSNPNPAPSGRSKTAPGQTRVCPFFSLPLSPPTQLPGWALWGTKTCNVDMGSEQTCPGRGAGKGQGLGGGI